MSEAVKQYPAWQKAFRDMQVIRDQNRAESEAKACAEKANEEAKAGYRLQQALMHFGIFLDPAPVVNEAEVDGFLFKLLGGSYEIGKNNDRETVSFTLVVWKPIPGRSVDDDAELLRYRHLSVSTIHQLKTTTWDYYLCQLADCFDEIDEAIAYDIARDAARKKQIEEVRINAPESNEQKLMKLLRAIIRDEIQRELEY